MVPAHATEPATTRNRELRRLKPGFNVVAPAYDTSTLSPDDDNLVSAQDTSPSPGAPLWVHP
jgi:hypothetical protein